MVLSHTIMQSVKMFVFHKCLHL
uniref:Uncharacterized protein n=1 Tax=Anguilla anguilla TaxID=7936 RepID=A0A0E9S8U9_ANGAN